LKTGVLTGLEELEGRLRQLRKAVDENPSDRISRMAVRGEAAAIADLWVEKLRSPLEYRFKLPKETIEAYASGFKRLHVLSRPNNHKSSYLAAINSLLKKFKDRLVLPVQQFSEATEQVLDLFNLVRGLSDAAESAYLREAIECAARGYRRASIVMGWCAAVDRIQRKIQSLGLDKFSQASGAMKGQTSGRFKRWNKEFNVSTLNELQEVFDADLIWICEWMGLLDSNQGDRLRDVCFMYRNQSAHPGQAPIEDAHLVAFFTDINAIILTNPKFAVP
jgi:hypothetical protein